MYQYQTQIDVDTNSNRGVKALNDIAAKHKVFPQLIAPPRNRERLNDNGNPVFMLHSAEQVNIRNMIIEIAGTSKPISDALEPYGYCSWLK